MSNRHGPSRRFPRISLAAIGVAMVLASCASKDDAAVQDINASSSETAPAPPSLLYPDLFQAVAESRIYEPKDWVDVEPRADPATILDAWRDAGRPVDAAELRAFAARYFDPPPSVGAGAESALAPDRTLSEHIAGLWPALTRRAAGDERAGSLLPLSGAYIVPGGRFREVYYWDSYFTLLGVDDANADLRKAMADNFADQIAAYGFIPNANRTYYLSRSQPPFFFMLVSLLSPENPSRAYMVYLDALKAEHAFWMTGEAALARGEAAHRVVKMPDGEILNRYYDSRDEPRDESYIYDVETARQASRDEATVYRDLRAAAESGWDFSSRWFGEEGGLASVRTTEIVPVDLNAILFGLETAIAQGCAAAGEAVCVSEFDSRAQRRAAAVRKYLWAEEPGRYVDFDFGGGERLEQRTAATVYPLFFHLASANEAEQVAKFVKDQLMKAGGVATTLRETGEQWDAPNGWAPLQWLAAQGLEAYGHEALAEEIARRWTKTVARGFCESGKLVEKYNVISPQPGGGGEYPTQDGFGWTNGVTVAFLERYPALSPLGEIQPHPTAPGQCADLVERLASGE